MKRLKTEATSKKLHFRKQQKETTNTKEDLEKRKGHQTKRSAKHNHQGYWQKQVTTEKNVKWILTNHG